MANKYTKQYIDIEKVIELYESGLTQDEVAEKMTTTQKVIYTRLKQAGYKCRIAKKRDQLGNKNHMWKGKEATYAAKHYRIYKQLGCPRQCEVCKTTDSNKRYEWANLTGNYDDPKDYKRMCKKCHHNYDIKSHPHKKNGDFQKKGVSA